MLVMVVVFGNRHSAGPKNTDAAALKREALELVRGWPDDLVAVMRSTPDDAAVKTPLVDRWLWPGIAPPASRSGVVLVGDAWHPMTPNLGQGACCALEDSVVLARRLAPAVLAGARGVGGDVVGEALRGYERERWGRVFPLTARAGLVGALVQWGNPAVCAVRDAVVIPRLVRLGPFLEHTNFECGLLEPAAPSP
jgi:2-polyprenyl-6-methoxyphenol hydroxylase-like FAD-dependent oxidoreductase